MDEFPFPRWIVAVRTARPSFQYMTGKATMKRNKPNRTLLMDPTMRENHDSLLTTLKESDMRILNELTKA